MIKTILKKIFGTRNQRLLKQISKMVNQVNVLEPSMQALSDLELKAKTVEFKNRLKQGETLDALLPETFAVVREASKRTLGLRHFDVQIIGGVVLHSGKIAEMRTGEGKTLVATLPAYLNALAGTVHVVTVNDYLAQRDANWMRPVYEFLGLSVSANLANMTFADKKAAYACDIVYGTNNEFGFDYLRDNMAFNVEDQVQTGLNYAIVDEVDSILIDEARTPLIISGPAEESSELYKKINKIIPQLKKQAAEDGPGDYSIDEKAKQVYITEAGHSHIESLLTQAGLLTADESLYDIGNIALLHHVTAALRAHTLFQRDVDYIVKDDQVVIVDEHTGRLMAGRRWSDGLHQATEAKENVTIQNENQTLATITLQNYFRLYQKLSGMTGTADTEAYEFQQIYGLEVVVIPTNEPVARQDLGDEIYLTFDDKFTAIVANIKDCVARQQPVLVGTASIEVSELLSKILKQAGIEHQVLNAKFHDKEAKIIAEAGRPSAVTIATNMAGRGTDIVLGGNLEAELAELDHPSETEIAKRKADWQARHQTVIAAGGLHVLGTERNESRRIDNQLRGRSGRQGDPGSSKFYLSMQDNLMRIFASDRVAGIMEKLGLRGGEAISHPLVTRAIENAQRKVEGRNFDIRKQLLEFDDVANDQRKVIYQQRDELLHTNDVSENMQAIRFNVIEAVINQFIPPQSLEEMWDAPGLEKTLAEDFNLPLPIQTWLKQDENLHEETLRERIHEAYENYYKSKEAEFGPELMRHLEKSIMLQSLDAHWKEHLAGMDLLRQGIHLRGYAQKNPKQEYKRECFEMFTAMLESIKRDVLSSISRIQVQTEASIQAQDERMRQAAFSGMQMHHSQDINLLQATEIPMAPEQTAAVAQQTYVRDQPKVGRNDACPCGSGKKYKQCHGKLA